MDEATLEDALAVLEAIAPQEPSVADAVDALEAVVEESGHIRTVLDRAVAKGIIERGDRRIRPAGDAPRRGRRGAIVTKEGDFACRRCGRSLSTGYFLRVDGAEVGPYGSTCVRKVTGRA